MVRKIRLSSDEDKLYPYGELQVVLKMYTGAGALAVISPPIRFNGQTLYGITLYGRVK